jgi:large subunit ribosomal protein L21
MFAVIKTGGKQYRAAPGDVLTVEKLSPGEGEAIEFDQVLMLGGDAPTLGAPLVEGARVRGEILRQFKGEKVISFKKRRRKHGSQTRKGHRQQLTEVRVTEILGAGGESLAKHEAKAESPAAPAAEAETQEA